MGLEKMTMQDYMILQNRFQNLVILAGQKLANLSVILTMENQEKFIVIYTENDFKSYDVHLYCCLRDAFDDFNNAYAIERGF